MFEAANIYIPSVEAYIRSFAKTKDAEALLILALRRSLLKEEACYKRMMVLPEDAHPVVRDKWDKQTFYEFDPALAENIKDKVRHVADWIGADVKRIGENPEDPSVAWIEQKNKKGVPIRLTQIKTLQDAYKEADKATHARRKERKTLGQLPLSAAEDKNVRVVMRFEDGSSIVRLKNAKAADHEGDQMNHCVGDGNYDKDIKSGDIHIYSFRDSKNRSHVTMEVEAETNSLVQCKGKGNQPPSEKYFQYLKEFFKKKQLNLEENASHTGVVKVGKEYYNIFNLPENLTVDTPLNLLGLKRKIEFPVGFKVNNELTLPFDLYPVPPKNVVAKKCIIEIKNKEGEYDDYVLKNGSRVPAIRIWNEKGDLIGQKAYQRGMLEDIVLKDGTRIAAIHEWNDEKMLILQSYRKYGREKDIEMWDGSYVAAEHTWYGNGQLKRQVHSTRHDIIIKSNSLRIEVVIPKILEWDEKGNLLGSSDHDKNEDLLEFDNKLKKLATDYRIGYFIDNCESLQTLGHETHEQATKLNARVTRLDALS